MVGGGSFGNAKELLPRIRRWQRIPADDELAALPFVHNAHVAGLAGIVGLAELAGQGDGENTFSVLFDYHALFQAKTMILTEPCEELVKYLDVPAFYGGDLVLQ